MTKVVPQNSVVLSARGISVHYAGARCAALEELDLDVRAGERVALLGPSGGGKTSLLRALEGSVGLAGGSIERVGRCALIYQDLRLVAEQSVLANVCTGAFGEMAPTAGLMGFPAAIRGRAGELLTELGLEHLARRRVGTLSGGQRQRVAIARALCARPAVLLADEPMASLDPENAARILGLLRRLQARHGFGLVLSLHDPGPDPRYFDRYLVVAQGRVTRETTSSQDAWQVFAHSRRLAESCAAIDAPRQDTAMGADRPGLRQAIMATAAVAAVAMVAWAVAGIDTTGTTLMGTGQALADFGGRLVPDSWAAVRALPWAKLGRSLVETVQMAIIGTAVGIGASLPLAVLASRATAPPWLRTPMRLVLNVIRTIPAIFWALFFVIIVGLGPVAGVLGLAAYSVGYLTKFFYEGLEDTDGRPAEALRALGASRLQVFFRAILPAARPVLVASCLFVLEYNVRSASILGIVGAGGIGQDLMYYIEYRNFPAAVAGLLMILIVVIALDSLSQWWRRRLVRQRGT